MNIYKHEYTTNELLKGKSMVRFGDGELHIMNGGAISFQRKCPILQERLREIINSDEENMCLAVFLPKRKKYTQILKSKVENAEERWYHDALLSRTKNNPDILIKIINAWSNKDVVIVHHTADTRWLSITRNAKSTRFIITPMTHAFNDYEKILENCLKDTTMDTVFLISCGPTATVLAYDLCKKGFQALDLGRFYMKFDSSTSGGRTLINKVR